MFTSPGLAKSNVVYIGACVLYRKTERRSQFNINTLHSHKAWIQLTAKMSRVTSHAHKSRKKNSKKVDPMLDRVSERNNVFMYPIALKVLLSINNREISRAKNNERTNDDYLNGMFCLVFQCSTSFVTRPSLHSLTTIVGMRLHVHI